MLGTRLPYLLAVVALTAGACSKGAPTGSGTPSPTVPSASASADPSASGSAQPQPRAQVDDRTPKGRIAPAPPPPGRAPQHTPPAPGTYRYTQSGSTKLGALSYEPDPQGTLVIERARLQGSGQAQRQVRTISDRNEITSVYLFTAKAVTLTYISQQGVECAPEPALTAVQLPLEIDATWKSTGTCGDLTADLSGQVMAEETLTIAGERVKVFRIHLASEIRSTGFFQTTGIKAWLSPDHRLVVRSEEASRGSFNGAPFESTLNAEIVELTPA